jgi:hypothetical protein
MRKLCTDDEVGVVKMKKMGRKKNTFCKLKKCFCFWYSSFLALHFRDDL